MPVDQRTIPYGVEVVFPLPLAFVEISLSLIFVTIDPNFTSMPSLPNFPSAKFVILLSNLKTRMS